MTRPTDHSAGARLRLSCAGRGLTARYAPICLSFHIWQTTPGLPLTAEFTHKKRGRPTESDYTCADLT